MCVFPKPVIITNSLNNHVKRTNKTQKFYYFRVSIYESVKGEGVRLVQCYADPDREPILCNNTVSCISVCLSMKVECYAVCLCLFVSSLFLFFSFSPFLFFSLSLFLFFSLPLCLFVSLSLCLSLCLFVSWSLGLTLIRKY